VERIETEASDVVELLGMLDSVVALYVECNFLLAWRCIAQIAPMQAPRTLDATSVIDGNRLSLNICVNSVASDNTVAQPVANKTGRRLSRVSCATRMP
jgi:hypothetical protein